MSAAREGLQRYQIMDPLGSGSQGHTFRAIDRETGDEVAVKVLSLEGATQWKAFELFEREATVLAGLRHPGIPRYRAHFASEDSGDYFLVMDLVEGRTLAQDMAVPGAFDELRLRELLAGLLDILDYLHSRTPPVIHRDIKPANIVVDREGGVHLVDFGGVRVAARTEGGSTMIGTFGYMAPEQLHGEAGPGVDLYALGATLTALAAGRPADELPHEGLAIDLDALVLPAGLRPILAAMLEPDPRDRVGSVAEVRALLGAEPDDGERARERASADPAADSAADPAADPGAALAVPGIVDELAQTPRPMSILVWLTALFGAGVLIMVEFAILPIVYLILRAVADKKRRRGAVFVEDEARIETLREFRRSASRQRQLVAHVIQGTSPLRDDAPALPAAPEASAQRELDEEPRRRRRRRR